MPVVIALLCLSFAAVGFVQVVVWSAAQDLGKTLTGVMSGWTNVWGALSNVAGPVVVAFTVKVTGSWASGLFLIATAAAFGAIVWLFLHPERPLEDEVAAPASPKDGATSHESLAAGQTVSGAGESLGAPSLP